jgi:hypothetical protein
MIQHTLRVLQSSANGTVLLQADSDHSLSPARFACVCADIQITDADVGIEVSRSLFVTIQNTKFHQTAGRPAADRQLTGHHALWVSVGSDVLVEDFTLNTKFVHDLSVDKFAQGIVWSNGKGKDIDMDHHKAQNYASLWVNIDAGKYILWPWCVVYPTFASKFLGT